MTDPKTLRFKVWVWRLGVRGSIDRGGSANRVLIWEDHTESPAPISGAPAVEKSPVSSQFPFVVQVSYPFDCVYGNPSVFHGGSAGAGGGSSSAPHTELRSQGPGLRAYTGVTYLVYVDIYRGRIDKTMEITI